MPRPDSKSRLGTASELFVEAIFTLLDYPVARPCGNQPGWDLVVFTDDRWKTVQVRTAYTGETSGASVQATNPNKSILSTADADLLAAYLPETGTLWLIPTSGILGCGTVCLSKRPPFYGPPLPEGAPLSPPLPLFRRRKSRVSEFLERPLPSDRPSIVSPENWDMLQKRVSGVSAYEIGRQYHIHQTSVMERIWWTVKKLNKAGLIEDPPASRTA